MEIWTRATQLRLDEWLVNWSRLFLTVLCAETPEVYQGGLGMLLLWTRDASIGSEGPKAFSGSVSRNPTTEARE